MGGFARESQRHRTGALGGCKRLRLIRQDMAPKAQISTTRPSLPGQPLFQPGVTLPRTVGPPKAAPLASNNLIASLRSQVTTAGGGTGAVGLLTPQCGAPKAVSSVPGSLGVQTSALGKGVDDGLLSLW